MRGLWMGFRYKFLLSFSCFFICFTFLIVTCGGSRTPRHNVFLNRSNWNKPTHQTLPFRSKHLNLFLYSKSFSQGNAVYIEILPVPQKGREKKKFHELDIIRLKIKRKNGKREKKQEVILDYMGWGYRGFWGIHPNLAPGEYLVHLNYEYQEEEIDLSHPIQIYPTKFPTLRKTRRLSFKKYSDVDQEKQKSNRDLIARSSKKKKRMFQVFSETKIGHRIAHPRDEHYVTSEFWTKRVYSRYRIKNKRRAYLKPKVNIHRGLDLRGAVGKPIYAIAGGEVLIADKFYYEGNFVLIDHGSRIFSGYMHQEKILVEEGDRVKAGEKIGSVGHTGRATGPHLHIFLKINDVYVDPLSLISLPIRN